MGTSFQSFKLAALSLLLGACVAGTATNVGDSLVQRLKNRGPVALSTENPFLAGNLLITREMESSPEIQGFIKHRGAPAALEVEQHWFSPLVMHFYYPENREQFTLEELQDTWIIRGPLPLQRDKQREVFSLTRQSTGAPALEEPQTTLPSLDSSAQKESFPSLEKKSELSEPRDPFLTRLNRSSISSTAKETGFRSPAISQQQAPETPKPRFSGSLNQREEDQRFLKDLIATIGSQSAEISPKGDLVHYVTYPGETLSVIARWYTFDRDNAERLARTNNMTNANQLNVGDTVVVPSYMVKNKSRLTEQAIQAMIQHFN